MEGFHEWVWLNDVLQQSCLCVHGKCNLVWCILYGIGLRICKAMNTIIESFTVNIRSIMSCVCRGTSKQLPSVHQKKKPIRLLLQGCRSKRTECFHTHGLWCLSRHSAVIITCANSDPDSDAKSSQNSNFNSDSKSNWIFFIWNLLQLKRWNLWFQSCTLKINCLKVRGWIKQ